MIAIEISSYGPPSALKPVHRPDPEPKSGELLIRVAAAGVAQADTHQRRGTYPPPPGASDIPGLDVAGEVAALGEGVTGFSAGEPVCAILAGGGYAELVAVPALQVLPSPAGWSDAEAATLPENLFTAFDNLLTRAGLKPAETVLVHGGTSGVGSTAIMLARAVGATVFATAGSDQKCEACLGLGAHAAISYRTSDFVAEVLKLTGGRGVDVILDMVGGAYLDRNLNALAPEGRLAILATQGGSKGELDIAKLMRKRARVVASTMRARTPDQKGEVAAALQRTIWPALPQKNPIRPVIDSSFPLEQAWRAHERMESGDHIGKIVLITDWGRDRR